MKTSNKLLLVFFLALFFSVASLMVYAKTQLVIDQELSAAVVGEENFLEKVMLDNLTVNNIEMGDNFRYTIDPNSTSVVIQGDSSFISKLTIVQDGQFRILTGGVGGSFNWPDHLHVKLGVKNLEYLKLDINGNAEVAATEAMFYDEMSISLGGNAKCTLELDVREMNINAHGNGKLIVQGRVGDVNAEGHGNSKLNFEASELDALGVNIHGNSKFYGATVVSISGQVNGNGKIAVDKVFESDNVSTSGNGRFTIRN